MTDHNTSTAEHDHPIEDFDRGLAFDLHTMSRRRALRVLGVAGLGALAVAACGSDSSSSATTTGTAPQSTATPSTATPSTAAPSTATPSTAAATSEQSVATATAEIPDETGGPYPGDGTNGVNVLTEDGIVRSDITPSFGASSTIADGIPMTVVLSIQDVANGGNPLSGAAVYLWHCDAAGRYSLYSDGVTGENYLRGVQEVDANGQVTFTTIVPGCYSGRWPHMHFEIYESLASATNGQNAIKTSQLALTQAVSEAAYADARYPQSAANLAQISLASDNVFGEDSAALQLAILTGSNEAGYTAVLPVGV